MLCVAVQWLSGRASLLATPVGWSLLCSSQCTCMVDSAAVAVYQPGRATKQRQRSSSTSSSNRQAGLVATTFATASRAALDMLKRCGVSEARMPVFKKQCLLPHLLSWVLPVQRSVRQGSGIGMGALDLTVVPCCGGLMTGTCVDIQRDQFVV